MSDLNASATPTPELQQTVPAQPSTPSSAQPTFTQKTSEKPFGITQWLPEGVVNAVRNVATTAEAGLAKATEALATTAAQVPETPRPATTPDALLRAREIITVLSGDPEAQSIREATHTNIITRAEIDLDPEKTRHDLIAGLQELKKLYDAGGATGIENPALITEWIAALEKLQPGENFLAMPRLLESLRDLFRSIEVPPATSAPSATGAVQPMAA